MEYKNCGQPTKIHNITLYNCDCMQLLKETPDKYYELAIVDPPYGLGKRTTDGGGINSQIKFMKDIRRTNWDDFKPSDEYFNELFRVSKNQIIWGGNYFKLPPSRTIICWEKMVYIPTMSQIELAWTSFDTPARLVKINNTDINRFHPTQKPVKLYKWLLKNYAKEGDKILDTHGGSMSIAIAIHKMNTEENMDLTLDLVEIDEEYYRQGIKRVQEQTKQNSLFDNNTSNCYN